MSKILGLLVAILFLMPTFASAQVTITLGSATINAGASDTVAATVATDGSAVALQFDVLYDPALLSFSAVTLGSALTADHTLTNSSISPGRERVVITTSPVTPLLSGPLVTFNINVSAGALSGTTPLTWDGVVISDPSANSITPSSLTPGSITIVAGAPPTPTTPAEAIPGLSLTATAILAALLVLTAVWKGGRRIRLIAVALFALYWVPFAQDAQAQVIPGDANADGRIDIEDIRLIVERILERGVLQGDGDCNGDLTINVLDTVCTLQPSEPGLTDPIILGPGDRSIPAQQLFEMNLFATDPDTGSTLTWELLSGPTSLTVTPAGVLSWTPVTGDLGDNALSVRVTDNTARSNDASFNISVFMLPDTTTDNAPPTLVVPANQSTPVGIPLALQLSANDPDPGDTLSYSLIDAPSGLTIDASNGAIEWPAQANAVATADVVVAVSDAAGATAFGRFTVQATADNTAPVALDDIYVARKGETLVINPETGVLQNDSDPNGDDLAATQLSDPALGTLDSFNADGSFSYTTLAPTPITIGLVEKCRTIAVISAGTISVADMDGDGDVEMAGIVGSGNLARVFIADPRDCSHEFFPIAAALGQPNFYALSTLVNLDDDPELELVAPYARFNDSAADTGPVGSRERLMAVNIDGTPLAAWPASGLTEPVSFDARFAPYHKLSSPLATDLDGDGNPELITGFNNAEPLGVGSTSSNAVVAYDGRTGAILWEFRGGITKPEARGASPVLVDLDLDGDTEIIWNQFVLDHTGELLFELPAEQTLFGGGNTFLTSAIANFNTDAFPEILAYDRSNIYLFTHTGALIWQRPFISNGSYSELTIAELDGDPFPEFVAMLGTTVPTGNVDTAPATLYAFDSDGQDLWNNIADGFLVRTLTGTRSSTPVAFDMDQDGIDELIQLRVVTTATPSGLYIINGETGETIEFQALGTTNNHDQPVTVADVDGDGSAEIITNTAINFGLDPLQVWDNLPGNPFPPARSVRTQTSVQPTWVSTDATPLSEIKPHWLQPGRNGWNMIQPDVDPLAPEQDSFTYRVSDGEFDSNIATVNLEVRPAGNPPFFISEPDTATSRGVTYEYLVLTVDVDPGDIVSYALVNGPPGMSIGAQSGVLTWYADANGEYPVSIIASDNVGRSNAQIFQLLVGDPVVVPDVVGSSEAAATTTLGNTNLFTGDVFRRIHPTLPAGTVYEQNPIAGAAAQFGAEVDLFVSSGPGPLNTDDDGDGFTENQGDCNDADSGIRPGATDTDGDGIDQDCDGIDGNKTLVAIELTPDSKRVLTNSPLPLSATGIFDDGTAQDLTELAAWTRGPTFFEPDSGNFTAQASFKGVTGSAAITVVERVDEDLAPVAQINTPDAGATVGAPTNIVGIATDPNLLRWELAYQQDGQGELISFAEGSNGVNNNVIAEFDPSTLLNGVYNIRLRVLDTGGNVSEDTISVLVDSQLKVGNFTLQYTDLKLPLNGIPITLARSYDSRDKRQGDFGVGWQLGFNSIELRTNRVLGTGWQVLRQGLVFGLVATDPHIAALRMPGGRIEAFEMVVEPDVSPIIPFPPLTQSVSFRALPGTLGTLESLGERTVSIFDPQPGPVNLLRDSDAGLYNPTLFRYTAPDGFKLDIDTVDGTQRAETPAGQVLTITPDSISHSNGTVVDIERDVAGRITRITDPAGFSQSYTYDANGDLRAHSDQADFVTRFDYDAEHNIINITDPLNRTVVRNEYDDAGRLISATNANGDTVSYTHDVDSRQELSTDPDGFVTVYDYDDDGNVMRITDPLGGITTNTYDAQGNRLSSTNAEGETTTFTYDVRANALSKTDAIGATTTYTYDERDQRISTRDALGRTTKNEYDTAGRLVSITDASGVVTLENRRDSHGNLIATADARGNSRRFEYNAQGYRTALIDPRGNRTLRTVNANGHVLGTTDARGGASTMNLDGRGLPTSVQAPAGNTMGFDYNGIGELASVSDSVGNRTLRTVDAAGRVTRFEDPDGNANQMFFDGRGNRTQVIDSSGRETRYQYDELGRQVGITLAGGGIGEMTYDAVGRKLTETDPNGNVMTYEYDAVGRNTALVDALDNRTEFTYDLVGNLTSRLDARGNRTDYAYDALDRLIETAYPDGSEDVTNYDEIGNVTAETDRLGRNKTYSYDPNDNLLSVTDIDGSVSSFSYDANNNRISQTDANGNTTRMVYDGNDRTIQKQYPDGSTEQYSYNAAGHLERTVLPDGKFIDATFDGFGRPTGHNLNGEGNESFTYDGAGRLTQAFNLWGIVDYSYDTDGRVTEIRSEGGHAVRYTYDDLGNRTSISTQLGTQAERITAYTYDTLNRLETVAEPDGDTTAYTYDPVGNIATITYPNSVVSSFTYDNVNQLTRIAHRQGATTLAAYDYTLDAGSRRMRVDHANGDSVSYSYDMSDRLLQETHRNAGNAVIFEETYAYDDVGNRLTQQVSGQAQNIFAYDSADKLLSSGATSFSYDANGRLTERTAPQGTVGYSYDVEGQLLRVTTLLGTSTYDYDASGKRRQRVVNGSEQNFLLDEASLTGYDQTLVAFDDADNSLAEYHWGDRLISADNGSSDRFYHFDANRNTRLLTDDAGAVSDSYDYDAFGSIRERTGTADNPYGFAGEWQQEPEGLVYLRARFYDAETGRFISRDPFSGSAENPVSLHRYLYANANPIMNTDPSGQFTLGEQLQISALLAFNITLITSTINGESALTSIPKALLSAGFAAAGGLFVGKVAGPIIEKAVTGLTSMVVSHVAKRGIVIVANATIQGLISAIFGAIEFFTSTSVFEGEVRPLSVKDTAKLFLITFVAEFVTQGYYQQSLGKWVDTTTSPSGSSLGAAAKSSIKGTGSQPKKLFVDWELSGQSIMDFLGKTAKSGGKNADKARSVLKNISEMSEEATFIIKTDFVDDVRLFQTSGQAGAWIDTSKQVVSPVIDFVFSRVK